MSKTIFENYLHDTIAIATKCPCVLIQIYKFNYFVTNNALHANEEYTNLEML